MQFNSIQFNSLLDVDKYMPPKTGVADDTYTMYTYNTEKQIHIYYIMTIVSLCLNAYNTYCETLSTSDFDLHDMIDEYWANDSSMAASISFLNPDSFVYARVLTEPLFSNNAL
jgi:hypothetical protein